RVDRELPVRVSQVVLDGLRAEEERRRSLTRRLAVGEEERDLELLRRQLVERRRDAAPGRLAGRRQLGAGKLAPRDGAELVEDLESCPELLAGVLTTSCAPQPPAEDEVGAGALEHVRRPAVLLERFVEPVREDVVVRDERPDARGAGERPRLA